MPSVAGRAARSALAGGESALRWLVVLIAALAVIVPTMRVGVEWYARGRIDLEPAGINGERTTEPVAVEHASPAEVTAVREAIGALRYRIGATNLTIIVADDALSPAEAAEYLPHAGVVRLRRDVVRRGGALLSWAVAHEIGHYVDETYLDDSQRQRFRAWRGIAPGAAWMDESVEWPERPAEDFAEVFAAVAQAQPVDAPETAYGRIRGAERFERLLADAGVRLGPLAPPDGAVELARREAAFFRIVAADPVLGGVLLVMTIAYLLLAAVPPARDAWHRGGLGPA